MTTTNTSQIVSQIKEAIEEAKKVATAMNESAYELVLVRDIDDRRYLKVYSNKKLLTEREISEEEYEEIINKFEDYTIVDEISDAIEHIFETLKLKNIIRDYEIEYDYCDKDIANTSYYESDIYVLIHADKEIIEKLAEEFEDALIYDDFIKIFIANVLESESTTTYLLVNNEQRVAKEEVIYATYDRVKQYL